MYVPIVSAHTNMHTHNANNSLQLSILLFFIHINKDVHTNVNAYTCTHTLLFLSAHDTAFLFRDT